MITLFYSIKKERKHCADNIAVALGFIAESDVEYIYTYHEFRAEMGLTGYLQGKNNYFDSAYKTFTTHDEALNYAKERGGVDAYSY